MQKKLLRKAESYARENRGRQIWRKFVRVMACIVVFCTTYALILPAITMEKNQCGLEEHTHSGSCYEKVVTESIMSLACTYESLGVHKHTPDCFSDENRLCCGQSDYLIHVHNADCMDENGTIVCLLPEVSEHEHTDVCYEAAETEPAQTEAVHSHGEECYAAERGALICQLTEEEVHTHGEECSETTLVCTLEEETHVHEDGCYETSLLCQLPETAGHTHDAACYETVSVLICELEEGAAEETTTTDSSGIITLEGIKHGDRVVLKGIPLGCVWKITEL